MNRWRAGWRLVGRCAAAMKEQHQVERCTPNKAGRAEDRQIYEAALWQWTGMQAAYQYWSAAARVMAGGSDTTVRWNNS